MLRTVHNISLTVFNDYAKIPDVTWNLVYESLPSYYGNFGDNPIGLNLTKSDRIGTCSSSIIFKKEAANLGYSPHSESNLACR